MSSSWNDLDLDETPEVKSGVSDSNIAEDSGLIDLFSEEGNQFPENSFSSENEDFRSTNVGRVTTGRVVAMVFMGLIMSVLMFFMVFGLYTRFIRFPDEQERVWKESRLYALQNFYNDVNSLEVGIKDSYLMRELSYANGNKDREAFIRYVVGTVSYSTDTVAKKNVYGNDLVDRKTGEILTEKSWLVENEKAEVHYIDYASIEFDSERVKQLVKGIELTSADIDYQNKLTDLFCQYIYSIDVEELPLVSIPRVPQMYWNDSGYEVLLSEDIYLDRVLFSSKELYDCFERFAVSVSNAVGFRLSVSSEYSEWEKLSDANKKVTPMPLKYGKHSINHTWCGAYYLLNDYKGNQGGVAPQLGDGSKKQPASVGTPVITYVLQYNEDGGVDKLPIRITLKEFGASQKAIDWFQAKHIQNRGYDVTSELQYCYFVFEVTNLSNESLTIYDNSALCDANANSSGRTGVIYGLQTSIVLAPEETGIIESWGRSTELNLKYVIWGADFARIENPVWFRVLAGDLEDPTWEKGVYINDTRG